MSKCVIKSGICGFTTQVNAKMKDDRCFLEIASDCPSITKLAEEFKSADPMQEIMYQRGGPLTFKMAQQYSPHPSCSVPIGILKAVEVEAGLALPKDVSITVERT